MNFLQANRIAPDGTLRFEASHLGLFCLPMSHKKDAKLKQVKTSSPRATIAHLRVYSHLTKKLGFLPYMGMVASWFCDLETLLTSAEQLLSGLCILLPNILVHLKKSSYKVRILQ